VLPSAKLNVPPIVMGDPAFDAFAVGTTVTDVATPPYTGSACNTTLPSWVSWVTSYRVELSDENATPRLAPFRLESVADVSSMLYINAGWMLLSWYSTTSLL